MKLLAILALACTTLVVSAQICPLTEVVFIIDCSENAAKASSTDRDLFPFDLLKSSLQSFIGHQSFADSRNRFAAIEYSSSSAQIISIPQGSSSFDALNNINGIGRVVPAGSWTYRGLEALNFSPAYQNNLCIILSSQGGGTDERRRQAQIEYNRVRTLGWNVTTITLQGMNEVDFVEQTIVNGGVFPTYLRDSSPADPNDPKSYKELPAALVNIINNILCTLTTLAPTTTSRPIITRSTTQRTFGLCSQCLFDGGYGYDNHPTECDSFYQCLPGMPPIKMHCPAGTFWDGSSCNHMNKVPCPTAQCDETTSMMTFYSSGKCCNKYYQCVNGALVEQACRVDEVYDPSSRSCFRPVNITTTCQETGKYLCDVDLNGPVGPGDCNGYAPHVFGDPCQYMFGGIAHRVAAGTTWDQLQCTLTFYYGSLCLGVNTTDRDLPGVGGPASTCNAVFLANFDGGNRAVYSERLNRQLDVHSSVQQVILANNALVFTPEMSDPFYYYFFFANRQIMSNSALRIRFRLDNPVFNVVYDLLSNNYCALCPETVSITATAVSATRFVVTATFLTTFGTTVSTSAIIEVRSTTDFIDAVVIIGSSNVYGRLFAIDGFNNVNAPTDFNIVPLPEGATIETSKCGYQLGRGPNNHFIGMLDQFAVYENCQDINSVYSQVR